MTRRDLVGKCLIQVGTGIPNEEIARVALKRTGMSDESWESRIYQVDPNANPSSVAVWTESSFPYALISLLVDVEDK